MEKNLKKLRVVKFIPSIVVKYDFIHDLFLYTSGCLYDDLSSAREGLEILLKVWTNDVHVTIVRKSIVRKVIEL